MTVTKGGNVTVYVTSGTPPPPGGDTTPPSQPSGLQATAQSSSAIALSWSAATDNIGVTGYRIYRNGAQIATASTTSYSNTGLAASTNYCYTVAATDAAGNTSQLSGQACATTLAGSGLPQTIDLGAPYPKTTGASVAAGSAAYYHFYTTNASKIISLQMTTTDWVGNLDVIASNVASPTCDQIDDSLRYSSGTGGLWYGPVGTSNESLGLSGTWPAGTLIYVTVCNRTITKAGAKLYWTTY